MRHFRPTTIRTASASDRPNRTIPASSRTGTILRRSIFTSSTACFSRRTMSPWPWGVCNATSDSTRRCSLRLTGWPRFRRTWGQDLMIRMLRSNHSPTFRFAEDGPPSRRRSLSSSVAKETTVHGDRPRARASWPSWVSEHKRMVWAASLRHSYPVIRSSRRGRSSRFGDRRPELRRMRCFNSR